MIPLRTSGSLFRLLQENRNSYTRSWLRSVPLLLKSHASDATHIGRQIKDDYAKLSSAYHCPRFPIVLAHGLLGFDELHVAGRYLPGFHYWRGIIDAFRSHGIEVITASVPASASIEERASKLGQDIEQKARGKAVNIVAHSMGGLDARYLISQMQPSSTQIMSLTTISTPHQGTAFADYVFNQIGDVRLPKVYRMLEKLSLETGAFKQLTRRYMQDNFNPTVLNRHDVRYFSYGAATTHGPWSAFRVSNKLLSELEGPNDGLVSVSSSKWGEYKGTLIDVSHLDLINWTNRLRWMVWEILGQKRNFNAIAFYLSIADMLAGEGL